MKQEPNGQTESQSQVLSLPWDANSNDIFIKLVKQIRLMSAFQHDYMLF